MPTSHSIGNHLSFLSLGARAARSYAAELPKEAGEVAGRLDVLFDELESLNAQQEKAKQQLALLTRRVKETKKKSCQERSRLIRLAEATFGPRDPRIKEFRPAAKGQVRTARAPQGAPTAETANVEPPAPTPERPAGPGERGSLQRRETEPRREPQVTRPASEPSLPQPGHPPSASLADGIAQDTAPPRTRTFWWRPGPRRFERPPAAPHRRAFADVAPAHDAASRGPGTRP